VIPILESPKIVAAFKDMDARATADQWSSHAIALDGFRAVTPEKGIRHAKSNRRCPNIVDSCSARSASFPEVQWLIESGVFSDHATALDWLVLDSEGGSNRVNLATNRYGSKLGLNDTQQVDMAGVERRTDWREQLI
jgi:hypothetical protein